MNTNRIRYKQRDFHLNEIDEITDLDWSLERFGCGPTSIANILVNYGYNVTPVDISKKILFNKQGEFDDTFLRNRGINDKGLIYCLDRLIKEDNLNIEYEIVKIDFSDPNKQKERIIDLVKKGNCYHKESPALWCNECLTSIAQAELETKTIKSTLYAKKQEVTLCLLIQLESLDLDLSEVRWQKQ